MLLGFGRDQVVQVPQVAPQLGTGQLEAAAVNVGVGYFRREHRRNRDRDRRFMSVPNIGNPVGRNVSERESGPKAAPRHDMTLGDPAP
jgi:hypothetical protein